MESYLLLKTLHVVGVILFLGNIIVTGWWKAMADRTGDPAIIAFAQRQVTLTDWVFTLGGVVLLGAAGFANALTHDLPLTTPWIRTGSLLFIASGALWVIALLPLQTKLGRMAKGFAPGTPIPADYWTLERLWIVFGLVATLLPLAAVPVMVFKPG